MTKTDAHLIAQLEQLAEDAEHVGGIGRLAQQAAKRLVELVLDNEQLRQQGTDYK